MDLIRLAGVGFGATTVTVLPWNFHVVVDHAQEAPVKNAMKNLFWLRRYMAKLHHLKN